MQKTKRYRKETKIENQESKVLIVGGAGFIGSSLCRLLLDQNCIVFCLDNLTSGTKNNISDLQAKSNFNFIEHDVKTSLNSLSLPSFDYVFHLAGLDFLHGQKSHSLDTVLVNSLGTYNLLELVREKKAKLLLGSSLAVFQGQVTKRELSSYFGNEMVEMFNLGEAKRFSESLAMQYYNNYGVNVRIARLFDVYGPGMNLGSGDLTKGLFSKIASENKILIKGKGKEVVYPIYIQDLVLGLLKAMFSSDSGGKIYTLGSLNKYTLSELAKKIQDLHQEKELEIEYAEKTETGSNPDEEDILVSQHLLNWKPQIDIETGFLKTINWIRKNKEYLNTIPEKNKDKIRQETNQVKVRTNDAQKKHEEQRQPITNNSLDKEKPLVEESLTKDVKKGETVQQNKENIEDYSSQNVGTFIERNTQEPKAQKKLEKDKDSEEMGSIRENYINGQEPIEKQTKEQVLKSENKLEKKEKTNQIKESSTDFTINNSNKNMQRIKGKKKEENTDEKKENTSINKKQGKVRKSHFKFLKFILIFILTTTILLSPVLILGYYSFKSAKRIENIKKGQLKLDKEEISANLSQANIEIQRGQNILFTISRNLTPINNLKIINDLSKYYLDAKTYIELYKDENELAEEIFQYKEIVFNNKQGDLISLTDNIKTGIENLYNQLGLIESSLGKKDEYQTKVIRNFLPWVFNEGSEYKKVVAQKRLQLQKSSKFINELSKVFAYQGKKVYLVLFQDNMEIRPGGGYISGVGLLTFENGKFLDFQLFDTYKIDKNISGKIDPPRQLKEHLGEDSWYLRDSNWSPDFRINAEQAQWFVEKGLGKKMDGTIALDWQILKNILYESGPIMPSFYGQQITGSNIDERAIGYIQATPNSEDSKNFLMETTAVLFDEFKMADITKTKNMVRAVSNSLTTKNLLLSFEDKKVLDSVIENGWAGVMRGSVRDSAIVKKNMQNTYSDFLMLVEANMGINKANFYVKRNIDQNIKINADNSVEKQVNIVFNNQAQKQSWPAGDYKNYMRIFIPSLAKLEGIWIGNSTIDLEKIAEEEFDITNEYFYKGYGFLLNVPVGNEKYLKIKYQLKDIKFEKNIATYQFYWQKQPGVNNVPVKLEISYPKNVQVSKLSPGGKLEKGKVSYQEQLDKDKLFVVQMVK